MQQQLQQQQQQQQRTYNGISPSRPDSLVSVRKIVWTIMSATQSREQGNIQASMECHPETWLTYSFQASMECHPRDLAHLFLFER